MNIKNIIAALAITASASLATAAPVPSSFTYQGILEVDGEPVLADADFIIRLYDGPTFITQIVRSGIDVTNGQFQLDLGFPPALFDGTDYDLEFLVRSPAGGGAYQVLGDRQPLTTTPYAFHANSANVLLTPALIADNVPTNLVTIDQANMDPDVSALRVTRGPAGGISTIFRDRVMEIESDNTDIGLFAEARNFPVVGSLGADTASSNAAAVLGEVESSSPGGQYALWGFNLRSGNSARIGTDDFAADLDGDLRLTGDITKQYSFGSFDDATPIAYGFVNSTGIIANGTPNFSATWNAASLRYEIEIDNENYFFNEYVTVVTPTGSDLSVRTSSSSGRLLVTLENTSTQAQVQSNFQFITYRTAGAALIQGQQRPPLVPLNTLYTDQELNPNLAAPAPRIPIIIEPTTKSPIQRD